MNLLLRNEEELVRDLKTKGSLSSCNHEPAEFKTWRQARKTKNRIKTVNFKKADLSLFSDLLGSFPSNTGLKESRRTSWSSASSKHRKVNSSVQIVGEG